MVVHHPVENVNINEVFESTAHDKDNRWIFIQLLV